MGQNIVLTLQAMGLGGLYFNGMDGLSALGVSASDGVNGLGFSIVEDERWVVPNVVGLDGVYEGLCPPYYPDMHAAAKVFVERKFGPGGAYGPDIPGPWRDSAGVKGSVAPVQCGLHRLYRRGRPVHLREVRQVPRHPVDDDATGLRAGASHRHGLLRHALQGRRLPRNPPPPRRTLARRRVMEIWERQVAQRVD